MLLFSHSACYGVETTNNDNNNNSRYTKWYCQKCQHLQQQNTVQQNIFKKEELESGIDEIVVVTSQASSVEGTSYHNSVIDASDAFPQIKFIILISTTLVILFCLVRFTKPDFVYCYFYNCF